MVTKRTPWKQIDPQLVYLSFAPSAVLRKKSLERLIHSTGLARRTLLRRMDHLGLSIDSDAGQRAMAKHNRILRLSFECSREIPGALTLLRTKEDREAMASRKAKQEPITIADAAHLLRVSPDLLRGWIKYWKVLEPDAKGRVTPLQLETVARNPELGWLLPILQMSTEIFKP